MGDQYPSASLWLFEGVFWPNSSIEENDGYFEFKFRQKSDGKQEKRRKYMKTKTKKKE